MNNERINVIVKFMLHIILKHLLNLYSKLEYDCNLEGKCPFYYSQGLIVITLGYANFINFQPRLTSLSPKT